MRRRNFIALSAATAACQCIAGTLPGVAQLVARPSQGRPLKSYGGSCGMSIGVQSEKPQLQQSAIAQFVTTNFNLLTAGNELKWSRLRRNPDTFDFSDGDWMVAFARQHGMLFHGHNLCWNTDNPKWMASVLNKTNARQYLTDHIAKVVGRYAGKVDSWDVVNEPFAVWDGRPDGLYKGIWLDLLGPEYIDVAFHTASKADPKALRVLNIHHVEQDTGNDQKTRQLTLTFLKQLMARNVPIQAIGIESHLDAASPINDQSLDRFFKAIQDMGLQIMITELDINDTSVSGSKDDRDKKVAEYYYHYLCKVIPLSNAKRLIFWTATDKRNWMDYLHTPQYTRADAGGHRPGLLDANMQAKLAYASAVSAFEKVCR